MFHFKIDVQLYFFFFGFNCCLLLITPSLLQTFNHAYIFFPYTVKIVTTFVIFYDSWWGIGHVWREKTNRFNYWYNSNPIQISLCHIIIFLASFTFLIFHSFVWTLHNFFLISCLSTFSSSSIWFTQFLIKHVFLWNVYA